MWPWHYFRWNIIQIERADSAEQTARSDRLQKPLAYFPALQTRSKMKYKHYLKVIYMLLNVFALPTLSVSLVMPQDFCTNPRLALVFPQQQQNWANDAMNHRMWFVIASNLGEDGVVHGVHRALQFVDPLLGFDQRLSLKHMYQIIAQHLDNSETVSSETLSSKHWCMTPHTFLSSCGFTRSMSPMRWQWFSE